MDDKELIDSLTNIIKEANKTIASLESDLELFDTALHKEQNKNKLIDHISKIMTLTGPKSYVLVAFIHVCGWIIYKSI